MAPGRAWPLCNYPANQNQTDHAYPKHRARQCDARRGHERDPGARHYGPTAPTAVSVNVHSSFEPYFWECRGVVRQAEMNTSPGLTTVTPA